MTSRATFGDLATVTARHLGQLPGSAGPYPRAARPGSDAGNVAGGVLAVVGVMSRYVEDIWAVLDAERQAGHHSLAAWIRAASRAREALANATAFLQPVTAIGAPGQGEPGPAASALRAAALSMAAGRDLLHGHVATSPAGDRQVLSEWAPVITSVPLARALLLEVGGWAAQVAPYGSQAAITAMTGHPQIRRNLNHACQWLWVLSWAVDAARERKPVPVRDLDLLHAIPARAVEPRRQPAGGEPVTALCQGVISTAERARAAALTTTRRAAWSPRLTRESMRQVTDNAMITSWNLHLLLRALTHIATRDGQARLAARLDDAASEADQSRLAWLRAARAWDAITTDGQAGLSAEARDAAALALWTGRLAYARPDWAPELGPSHPARAPGDLAPGPEDLRQVVAAIHHACHALTRLAESGHGQLQQAARAGRLLVTARAVPGLFSAYPLAPAPASTTAPVLAAYDLARTASDRLVTAITPVADAVRSPSRALTAIARAAGHASPGMKRPPAEPPVPRHPHRVPPGPAERTLLDLGITSRADLDQAAALDQAVDQLIIRAATQAGPAHPGRDLSTSAGNAELISHVIATTSTIPPALHPPSTQQRHPKPGATATARAGSRVLLRAELPASTLAPSQARERLRHALTEHGLTALTDNAELLASEMVANAAEHATGKPIRLVLRQHIRPDERASITCEVSDTSPTVPQPRPATPDRERGRGLAIIAALATDHGVRAGLNGKTCWFTLTTPASPELAAPEPATRHIQAEPEAEAGA